jgi:biopolymer transport protein ExbB
MSKQGSSFKDALQNVFATSAILIAFIVSYLLFTQIMGNPANFEGGNPAGKNLEGNYLGIIYKGGYIVPILMTCVLVLIIFIIERSITLSRAKGKGRLNSFVSELQADLAADKIEEAMDACDRQKGSLANVMKGIVTFRKTKNLKKIRKSFQFRKHLKKLQLLNCLCCQKTWLFSQPLLQFPC